MSKMALEHTTPGAASIGSLLVLGLLTLVAWRRYLSPISDIPGPFTASFTRLWHMSRILKGDQNLELTRQHEKHGHFVRISYDEVSVSHPDAVKTILLAPLHKAAWYKIHAMPDYRRPLPVTYEHHGPKAKSGKVQIRRAGLHA